MKNKDHNLSWYTLRRIFQVSWFMSSEDQIVAGRPLEAICRLHIHYLFDGLLVPCTTDMVKGQC